MAITEKYVSTTGGGAHDGTTEADAMTFDEMVTAINAGTEVGTSFNVLSNATYSFSASVTITGDGNATSPIRIRGYDATIGDLDTQGRSSGGALNTTGFPTLSFGAGFILDASGGDYIIFECLSISANAASSALLLGTEGHAVHCRVANASSSASARGINGGARVGVRIVDCDIINTGGGAGFGAIVQGAGAMIFGCRVTHPSGTGIDVRSTADAMHCTVYGCATGIAVGATTATPVLAFNTIYGCSGDGIDVVTGTTTRQVIIGNHITDNGGYGIDYNTSTCVKCESHNRFRDNTSGNVNGGGDWGTCKSAEITTDNGAAGTDYVSVSTDFSLVLDAVGRSTGPGYLTNIGANGTLGLARATPGMGSGING